MKVNLIGQERVVDEQLAKKFLIRLITDAIEEDMAILTSEYSIEELNSLESMTLKELENICFDLEIYY